MGKDMDYKHSDSYSVDNKEFDPPFTFQTDELLGSPLLSGSSQPSRTVQVKYGNWKYTRLHIIDLPGGDNVLNTVKLKMRKPQMIFTSGSTDEEIGSATLHTTTSHIDLTINGRMNILKVDKRTARELTYACPSLGNATVTWRSVRALKTLDWECYDENSTLLAKIAGNYLSMRKAGTMEIFGDKVSSGAAFNEIVFTGLALAYFTLINPRSSGNAVYWS